MTRRSPGLGLLLPVAMLGASACLTPEPYVENVTPVATAGADRSVQVGENVTLDGRASRDSDGSIEGWSWNLGDGTVLDGEVVQHAYTSAGRYVVSLTVVDDRGGEGRDELIVTVGGGVTLSAVAQASPNPAQMFDSVSFDGSLSTPAADIARYSWRFGDGSSAEGMTATHAYTSAGRFRAVLEVADGVGHSDQAEIFVDVTAQVLDGTYDLTATPSTVSCARYSVSFGDSAITLVSSGTDLTATTAPSGHSFTGTQNGLSFSLSASYSSATGGSCTQATVNATINGTFDSADHFAGTASAYYDLGVPCQCSALFDIEGQRH